MNGMLDRVASHALGVTASLLLGFLEVPVAYADSACEAAEAEAPTEAGCAELALGTAYGWSGWTEVHLVDRPWGGLPGRIEIASVEVNERREIEIRLRRSTTDGTTDPSRFVLGVYRGRLRVVAPDGDRVLRIAPADVHAHAQPLPAFDGDPFAGSSLAWPWNVEVTETSFLEVTLRGQGTCSACECAAVVGQVPLDDPRRLGFVLLPDEVDDDPNMHLCAAMPSAHASARIGPLEPGTYELYANEHLSFRLTPAPAP